MRMKEKVRQKQGFCLKPERNDFGFTAYYGQTGPFSVETDVPPGFGDWFAAGNLLGFKAKDPNAHLETCTILFSTQFWI